MEVTLLSCADRLATRGRNADAAIAAHLELARELMGAALAWRARRARRRRRCAATSWRASSASPRGPSWAGCCAGSRRPPSPARRAIATQAVAARPVACARIPTGDRRLRGLRGRAPARRRRGPRSTPTRPAATTAAFAWIGLHEPTAGGVRVAHGASSTSTRSRWRTPSTRTSARSSRCSATRLFIVLKTARYVDPTEVVELGEILVFAGRRLRDHGPPRRGQRPARRARARSSGNPELLSAGPGAVVHAIVDKVVDDYQPAHRRPRGGRRGGRGRGLLARRGRTARSASTGSSARCSSSTTPPRRCWSPSTGSRAGSYDVIPDEVRDLLPGRERPPAARPRAARGLPRPAHRACSRRTSPR